MRACWICSGLLLAGCGARESLGDVWVEPEPIDAVTVDTRATPDTVVFDTWVGDTRP